MLMQEWAPQFFDITWLFDYNNFIGHILVWMLWVRIAEGFDGPTPQISKQDS